MVGEGRVRFSYYFYRTGRVFLSVAVTLMGLLLVTFLIGRVMPIDPVLAVVGDHASQETYNLAKQQMGLDEPLHIQIILSRMFT